MKRDEERYADEVGADALARQRGDSRDRHHCCGELVDVGHHPMCSKRPDDDPPAHVDGQVSLT